MLTRNLRKRGLESNKLEVVVVKIYIPLTEVKNNSKQSDHQGMELTLINHWSNLRKIGTFFTRLLTTVVETRPLRIKMRASPPTKIRKSIINLKGLNRESSQGAPKPLVVLKQNKHC